MKFILFFYLLSLSVIIGVVLTDDYITETSFYHQYLETGALEAQQQPINYNDLPSEVMKSFSKSAFSDKVISQAYIVSATPNLITELGQDKPSPEKMYLLTLATEQENMATTLKFTSKGKLVNVLN